MAVLPPVNATQPGCFLTGQPLSLLNSHYGPLLLSACGPSLAWKTKRNPQCFIEKTPDTAVPGCWIKYLRGFPPPPQPSDWAGLERRGERRVELQETRGGIRWEEKASGGKGLLGIHHCKITRNSVQETLSIQ